MTSPIVVTPKGLSVGGNTPFEPVSVTIGATVRPGGRIEKIGQYNKKVTKLLHFPYFDGPIRPKSCMVVDVHDVITRAKFEVEKFMVCDFTGGGCEFSIFLLIFEWALQSAVLMRCL